MVCLWHELGVGDERLELLARLALLTLAGAHLSSRSISLQES